MPSTATKTTEKKQKPAQESKDTAARAVKETKQTKPRATKVKLNIDKAAIKKLKLVAVAYSFVERDMFPTEEAYKAEVEVEDRARDVIAMLEKMGVKAKGYPADPYFVTNLLVDDPDFVLNLVDTLRGKDSLQTTIPAALELAEIPYTGAGMQGLTIGNDRYLTKQLLLAADIPTPEFQLIRRAGTKVQDNLGVPLIVKLNSSGGSVGIDNKAVQETLGDAQKKIDDLITTYKTPVTVERFIDGREINAIVFDDGRKKQVFLAEKVFLKKMDGKHSFTSIESYYDDKAWKIEKVEEPLASKVSALAVRAFGVVGCRDYAKFDIRVDDKTGTPYFTDCNPNTAFGPAEGYPIADVMRMYGIPFEDVLASLVSKYAKKIKR
jgi:D-alanine-D-alanine ligase